MFRFESWHVSAAYSCRSYKRIVVELVNALSPATVVEVGCGLGDILSRVCAAERVGLDNSRSVIRAARFLHPGSIRWIHGEAGDIAQVVPGNARIDCLVMVNWIHNLSPDELAACLLPLLPRISFLVLDAIDRDAPAAYRFKHDFAFLASSAECLSVIRAPQEPRAFMVFKVFV